MYGSKTTTIGKLQIAAMSAVVAPVDLADGEYDCKSHFAKMLQDLPKGSSEIDNTIAFLMESCEGDEPNFDDIINKLVARSAEGESIIKDAVYSQNGGAALHMANSRYITQAQKDDFFVVCKVGNFDDISFAINQLGAGMASKTGLASKILNDNKESGFHIAVKSNPNMNSKLFKLFVERGFDSDKKDVNGDTPSIMMEHLREISINDGVKDLNVNEKKVGQVPGGNSSPSSSIKASGVVLAIGAGNIRSGNF